MNRVLNCNFAYRCLGVVYLVLAAGLQVRAADAVPAGQPAAATQDPAAL